MEGNKEGVSTASKTPRCKVEAPAPKQRKGGVGIRDAVHNMIYVSPEEEVIVDHPLMQRLKRVQQLTGCESVYPTSKGCRFSHSLGTMKIAGDYAQKLYPDDPHRVQVARLAGLLHDVAHGPFSHAYDKAVYSEIYSDAGGASEHGHDLHRFYLVENDEALKKAVLGTGVELNELFDVWGGRDEVLSAVTQGPAGADRIDFLMRDAHFCGTNQFGMILPTRIIEGVSLAFDKERNGEPCLAYSNKVMDDVTNLLNSRFHMYKAVYHHKTCMGVKVLLEEIMRELSCLVDLKSQTLDVERFVDLDDNYVLSLPEMLRRDRESEGSKNRAEWNEGSKKKLERVISLSRAYKNRVLPKMCFEFIVDTRLNYIVDQLLNIDCKEGTIDHEELRAKWCASSRFIQGHHDGDTADDNVELFDRLFEAHRFLMARAENPTHKANTLVTSSIQLSPLNMESFEKHNVKISITERKAVVDKALPSGYKVVKLQTRTQTFEDYLRETNFFNGMVESSGRSMIHRIYVIDINES